MALSNTPPGSRARALIKGIKSGQVVWNSWAYCELECKEFGEGLFENIRRHYR